MTKIKLCGLTHPDDIAAANRCRPDYIGFVFARQSRRAVSPAQAALLKERLAPGIVAVGVFVDESPAAVAALLQRGIIDAAQLHGSEDETYLKTLRALTGKPLIQAFRIACAADLQIARHSSADFVLLDAGAGSGAVFDWDLLQDFRRPYFLAGGLEPSNVGQAIQKLHPYAVDVSSGIESSGTKDSDKMAAFVAAVRAEKDGAL